MNDILLGVLAVILSLIAGYINKDDYKMSFDEWQQHMNSFKV